MNTNHQKVSNKEAVVLSSINSSSKEAKTNNQTKRNISKVISVFLLCLGIIQFSSVNAANLLFKSNFGAGVSLGDIRNFSSTGKGAWQDIIGTDQETGFSWPVKALGSDFSGIQLITVDPVTTDTIGNYISNEIRAITGPDGKTVNELFQNVKIKAPVGQTGSQAPLMIRRPATIGDVTTLYITYWFKFPVDMADKLDPTVTSGNWRNQFELKTGGYNGLASSGDYRIIINIVKDKYNQLRWVTKGDNEANGPFTKTEYWRQESYTVPVPLGKWFKVEVYWHRSNGTDGRFWAAIDGQEIVDQYGPNMGDYNLPITRIIPHNAYTGGNATVESHTTRLEIWDDFPCGDGVSCYGFDHEAPTAPTALSSTMTTPTTTTTSTKGRKARTSTTSTASENVALSWNAASDNVGVSGYYVYRNGTKIGSTTSFNYTDSLSSSTGTFYEYTVKAFDAVGNVSVASSSTSVVY